MPEVKELAKELVKESAKKLTSHILAYIDSDKKASSSPQQPQPYAQPANYPSPGVADITGRFDSLSVNDNHGGGYGQQVPPQLVTPWPLGSPSYPGGDEFRPTFPQPAFGPSSRPPMSLTMQHALSAPSAAYPGMDALHPPAGDTPPRPSSVSALQPPDPGLSISAGPKLSASHRPSKSRSSSSSSRSSSDGIQCSGVTKAGKRCTRTVKTGLALAQVDPETDTEQFCYQHTKEVLSSTGFYSKKSSSVWVKFEDWIPDYLQADTQAALRSEMSKPASPSDVPGYIYTFEIRERIQEDEVKLKVGRAVNLVKRIDQWGKQCDSKEQVLRGWWPDEEDTGSKGSLMKGIVKAGEKGSYCHRLERLVHLELADLSVNAPYLEPHFPKATKSDTPSSSAASSSHRGRKSTAIKKQSEPCADCGQVHKEIFTFRRVEKGRYTGKEWDHLVKPLVEKWGAFVETHV